MLAQHHPKMSLSCHKERNIFHINACVPAETDAIIISSVIAVAIAAAQSMLVVCASAAR